MSHSITVTKTKPTLVTSEISIDTGYLKTWPGIFKLVQVIFGLINIGLTIQNYHSSRNDTETFVFIIEGTFLICSSLLLLSSLISISIEGFTHDISKTIFEFLYHGVAFVLFLAISTVFLLEIFSNYGGPKEFILSLTIIIAPVLAGSYLMSAIDFYRRYIRCQK